MTKLLDMLLKRATRAYFSLVRKKGPSAAIMMWRRWQAWCRQREFWMD